MYPLRCDEKRIIRCTPPSPGRALRAFLRLLLAGGLLALLAACSSLKLAYNNTPTLAYWWLDSYVDFEDAQSAQVRDALVQLQQWHRQAELPRLADLLASASQQAARDVVPEQFCAFHAQLRLRLDALLRQAEPSYLALAMGLQPQQLHNIAARLEKTNAEWREEWMDASPAQRLDKRLQAHRKRVEDFYGPLDEAQVDLLRSGLARSELDPRHTYRERLRRQQDLLQALRTATPGSPQPPGHPARAAEALRGYLQRSMQSPDAVYRGMVERNVTESCRILADLHNSTTIDQRNKAIRKIQIQEHNLRELSLMR